MVCSKAFESVGMAFPVEFSFKNFDNGNGTDESEDRIIGMCD